MKKAPFALRRLCLTVLSLAFAGMLVACASGAMTGDSPESDSFEALPSDAPASEPSASAEALPEEAAPEETPVAQAPVTYPTGWLAAPIGNVPAGAPVSVVYAPDFDIRAHQGGREAPANVQGQRDEAIAGMRSEGEAIVEHAGALFSIPADYLLVNMPDFLPQAVYDIVYSYSSTSHCAGEAIPGVTGERIAGYEPGTQANDYLGAPQFAVPCAYRTAVKARAVCDRLASNGLRLLVYDAYRPMTAQYHLSNALESAYYANPAIQGGMGGWSLTWYVANGPSGHNYGTDLDVGACDADGNPLPMPSSFDAFDESGHLAAYPLNSWDITPSAYRGDVSQNAACLLLHEAFVAEGFSELASEWWHFGDVEAESVMRSIVGPAGLDFVATTAGGN